MDIKGLNIVIAGGGTGGHLFPGVAIASAFIEISGSNRILFLNTGNKIEKNILNKSGFDYKVIPSGGILGKNLIEKLKNILKIASSISAASKRLDEFETDAVIGVGGYVSAPAIIAAWLKGIPVFIQEQNTIPGIANKIFSYIAKLNFISFKDTKLGPHKKRIFTGNPIRKAITENKYSFNPENGIRLLVTGGSQGAKAINQAIIDSFQYIEETDKIKITHQTGETDFENIQNEYSKLGINPEVAPFFTNFEKVYSNTDLIIARSGASTISEIACAAIPSILIPYPLAIHNHQYKNASSLEAEGAAKVIKESDLNGKTLAQEINNIVKNPDILTEMNRKMQSIAKPNAAYDICSYIIGKLN